ncbi:MAG: hypothetical protein KDC38_18710 [Planctomycetes bacterium]|nr:hypothetical protein [Planctomycetota bacterium]
MIWTIVERFYRTHHLYASQYEAYESKVAEYVEKLQTPRDRIRLPADELSRLLQFKQLERIRDRFLLPLKDACHALFRRDHSTDVLDRLVNDIFHEISILKEEHYNVLTYAVNPESRVDREEQKSILDEVHEMFPIKVHRLRHLFDLARNRMERILSKHKSDAVLVRSLFLNRSAFVAKADPAGLIYFYRWMYGSDRPFEGYRVAADSFFDAGFFGQAAECYAEGEEFVRAFPASEKRRWDSSWKSCRDHLKRRVRESRAQQAEFARDD